MKKFLLGSVAGLAMLVASTGVAMAADPAIADPAFDWSGFYLGGNIGYGEANFTGCNECDSTIIDADELDLNGVAGGVHAGFNHQLDNNIVLGIEGDIMFTDWSDHAENGPTDEQNGEVDLLASVRGRLGLAMDRSLIFVTGGVAISDAAWETIHHGSSFDDTNLNGIGGVVGGGGEFMMTDNISVRAEGLYYFIGKKQDISDFHSGSAGEQIEFDDAFVVRVGASIHFGGS